MAAWLALATPQMLAANFEVYRVAAEAALAGEDLYAVAPERFPEFFYLYPPIVVVSFLPFAAVALRSGFAIHVAVEVAFALALAAIAIRWIERHRRLARLDRLLVAGFVVGSIHTVPSLYYGQVNVRMAALFGLGLYLLERAVAGDGEAAARVDGGSDGPRPGGDRDRRQFDGNGDRRRFGGDRGRLELLAGAALAGAALLKVFPAAIGIWLLRLRAWVGVAAALATGLGGLAAGALLFGRETTRAFLGDVLVGETDADAFVGGLAPTEPYVTVRRPLSQVFPTVDPIVLTILAAVVVLPPVLFVYTRLETPTDRLVAAHATVLAVFVFVPSYPLYYVLAFATLVPALYLVADPLARRLLVAGALLANLAIGYRFVAGLAGALPPALGDPVAAGGTALLTVATPTLLGTLCMLAACVVYRYRRDRDGIGAIGVQGEAAATCVQNGEPFSSDGSDGEP